MRASLYRFNWIMFAAMLALIAVGTVSIWSAGNARAETVFHGMWLSNLATAGVGLVVYFALAFADYRKILEWTSVPAYAFAVVLLIAVLAFGSKVYGGRRWLWFFQPSEVAKLCVICLIARLFGGEGRRGFGWFALAAALIAVPTFLILLEPDLGTALTLVPAVVLMLFAARVWRRGLVTMLATGMIAAFALYSPVVQIFK